MQPRHSSNTGQLYYSNNDNEIVRHLAPIQHALGEQEGHFNAHHLAFTKCRRECGQCFGLERTGIKCTACRIFLCAACATKDQRQCVTTTPTSDTPPKQKWKQLLNKLMAALRKNSAGFTRQALREVFTCDESDVEAALIRLKKARLIKSVGPRYNRRWFLEHDMPIASQDTRYLGQVLATASNAMECLQSNDNMSQEQARIPESGTVHHSVSPNLLSSTPGTLVSLPTMSFSYGPAETPTTTRSPLTTLPGIEQPSSSDLSQGVVGDQLMTQNNPQSSRVLNNCQMAQRPSLNTCPVAPDRAYQWQYPLQMSQRPAVSSLHGLSQFIPQNSYSMQVPQWSNTAFRARQIHGYTRFNRRTN